jgi:SagB-type dehydrogenase family enzyme
MKTLATFLEQNVSLTRRQVCKFGAVLGMGIAGLLPRGSGRLKAAESQREMEAVPMKLSETRLDGTFSVERAIKERRTVRSFQAKPMAESQLSQVLWSAQGITEDGGFRRAAPSGGALYPTDIYLVVGNGMVPSLKGGVYHYLPDTHAVVQRAQGDRRKEVASACLGQMWMGNAPVHLVITAEYGRITSKYGDRGIRYALMEVGHIAQNVCLQGNALGLSVGIVGAFDDSALARAIAAEKRHEPLIVLPIGWAHGRER